MSGLWRVMVAHDAKCHACKKRAGLHKADTHECPKGRKGRAGYTDFGPGKFQMKPKKGAEPVGAALLHGTVTDAWNERAEQALQEAMQRTAVEKFGRALKDIAAADIDCRDQVIDSAVRWWRGHRPIDWNLARHLEDPTVNCRYTDNAKRLAQEIAAYIGRKP